MGNILISIIIPVYNVEKYICSCIESVLNQTYKNVEIIIINDGSTDRSLEIIERYSTNNNVFIVNKENSGQSDCRKIGYEMTRGDYVFFMDSDDTLEPDALETMLSTIIRDDSDFCCCRYRLVDEEGEVICESPVFHQTKITDNSKIIYEAFCAREIKTTLWTKLFRKDFLLKYGIEPVTTIKLHDDCIFTNMSAIYSDNVCFCNKILYNVLQREGSISRTCKPAMVAVYDDIYAMLQAILIKENKFIGNERAFYVGYCKCIIYNLMLLANRALNYKKFMEIYDTYSSTSLYYHTTKLKRALLKYNIIYWLLLISSYSPNLFFGLSRCFKKRINH